MLSRRSAPRVSDYQGCPREERFPPHHCSDPGLARISLKKISLCGVGGVCRGKGGQPEVRSGQPNAGRRGGGLRPGVPHEARTILNRRHRGQTSATSHRFVLVPHSAGWTKGPRTGQRGDTEQPAENPRGWAPKAAAWRESNSHTSVQGLKLTDFGPRREPVPQGERGERGRASGGTTRETAAAAASAAAGGGCGVRGDRQDFRGVHRARVSCDGGVMDGEHRVQGGP